MTREEKVTYWLNLSKENIEVAKFLLQSKHLLQLGFFCHLTAETIIKAYYTKFVEETPPFIHKLPRLAELSGLINEMSEEQKNLIFQLDPFNIEARYPEYKKRIAKTLNTDICAELLTKTETLQLWIQEKIS